jgi:hypothetical protein
MQLPIAVVLETSIPTPIGAIAPSSAEADSLVQNCVLVDVNGNTPLLLADKLSRLHSALMLLKDSRVDPCGHDHAAAPTLLPPPPRDAATASPIPSPREASPQVLAVASRKLGAHSVPAARVFDEMWSYHSVQEF